MAKSSENLTVTVLSNFTLFFSYHRLLTAKFQHLDLGFAVMGTASLPSLPSLSLSRLLD
ncbi:MULTISPECIES: hypothetical protein [Proteus]|uniref:hypothetical protein n=1 Tax=Proteus TaxID=583 RepID=UPI001A224FAE|nr:MULTISPECIES: hypothetical protein [Proteus]EKW4661334.1 hypothetical protein [Proteus mirabilis]ELB1685255.1 hypothetical protein [Proteus mirabilis]MCT8265422.1 hypothetical protein [Proteus terrae]MDC9757552.1 hypothetical protein [Proteus mirabilis]MDC9769562.1 hypothetical protein [Proteus mirabilis]